MLSYYLRLALASFARTPVLTALTITAIAVGIAIFAVTATVYQKLSGNPIWWKNDRLYAVTMDNYPAAVPPGFTVPHLSQGPYILTYRDATALYRSDIPEHKAIMYFARGVLEGGMLSKPERITTRVTTADFFKLFDVPFLYGGPWSSRIDQEGGAVIVLSRAENERLFAGRNSVGQVVRWNDRAASVVGVLGDWSPVPNFYDPESRFIDPPEDTYVPWGKDFLPPAAHDGAQICIELPRGGIKSLQDYLSSECNWISMWLELPTAASRKRMQAFIDNYWSTQRAVGRFPRPRANRLWTVSEWLKAHQSLVQNDQVLVGVGAAFFLVCVINVVGLTLAKILSRAPITGVRRALGARRRDIFFQHLVEAGALAVVGAVAGLCLAELCLWGTYAWFDSLFRSTSESSPRVPLETATLLWTLVLAVAAALGAGLYPAWRAGRLSPSAYLKSQ